MSKFLDYEGLKRLWDKTKSYIDKKSGVTSFKGRTGAVMPEAGDYTPEEVGAASVEDVDAINSRLNSASLALGQSVNANENYSIALGASTNAIGNHSTAIGYSANANGMDSIALGHSTTTKNYSDVAIGSNAMTNSVSSVAIGSNAMTNSGTSVAIGSNAMTNSGTSVAIGSNARTDDSTSIAIGSSVNTSGKSAIAIGPVTNAIEDYSIAFGYIANASGGNSIAIGRSASASGINSIVLGPGSNAKATYHSIAIGSGVNANGNFAIAVGPSTGAEGDNSTAIGYSTRASGLRSAAFGYLAKVTSDDTIQLGNASSLSSLEAAVPLTVGSDERDKTDISQIDNGAVAFLKKVKAIRYLRNPREMYIDDDENLSETDLENKSKYGLCTYDRESHAKGTKKGSRVRVGVLAQEVQAALQEIYGDASYANIVNDNLFDLDPATIPKGVESRLTVNYSGFIPFLIKAIQELSERIETLEEK